MFTRNKISALQEIRSWSTADVLRSLHQHGLSEVCEAFSRRDIDGDNLLDLTEGRLAMWKKDLSLPLVRKVSKFVTDLNAMPSKYLLTPEEDAEYTNLEDAEYLNTKITATAGSTASWLHSHSPAAAARGATVGSSLSQNDRRSPVVSETGSWDTDFDDDVDVNEAPPRAVAVMAPVASTLHRPVIPVKPGVPQRPAAIAGKIIDDRFKPTNNVQNFKCKITTPLPKPPEPKPESIISNLNFRKSLPNEYAGDDDIDYYEIEPNEIEPPFVDDYLPMEPVIPPRPNAPELPSREPKFKHPGPSAAQPVPMLPPRVRPVIMPNIPKINIPNQFQSPFPVVPPREYLTAQPGNMSRTSPEPPRKIGTYPNYPPAPQDQDDDEYEQIQDPGLFKPIELEDYLPPIVRQKPSDHPMLPPSTSPSRRESDASSTTSSSSGKLASALQNALISRTSDERERTATPELHKAPALPAKASSVDRPGQFATNQRPLPPTPDPRRPPERWGPARITSQPYYFNVDRKRAEEKLKNREDGCFLLRPSTRTENPFTLTLWYNNRLYNIYVRLRPDHRFALGSEKDNEQTFATVEELIAYYRKEQLVLYSVGERTGTTALVSYPAQDTYSPSPF